MSAIAHLPIAKSRRASASPYLDPGTLHDLLEPTATLIVTFKAETEMQRYRRLIYSINKQGDYRYRTLRDEASMWGIVVWRMR